MRRLFSAVFGQLLSSLAHELYTLYARAFGQSKPEGAGRSLIMFCANCGKSCVSNAKYCHNCGQKVNESNVKEENTQSDKG